MPPTRAVTSTDKRIRSRLSEYPRRHRHTVDNIAIVEENDHLIVYATARHAPPPRTATNAKADGE